MVARKRINRIPVELNATIRQPPYSAISRFCGTALKSARLQAPLRWFQIASSADWASLEDVRQAFRSVDLVGSLLVFNLRGNRYRLMVRINFRERKLFVKNWKKWDN